jgi:hypothetical protein
MVPMHDIEGVGAFHEPGRRIAACPGKAALKTHVLQTLRDRRASPNRAKRLECVRFIGAFRPERDRQWFMVPMHGKHDEWALQERRLIANQTTRHASANPSRPSSDDDRT